MPEYTLTYFNTRGRAEAIRLAFTLGKIKFTDLRLSYEEFLELKKQEKFKFSQLPVLDIDGKQFAQSRAILKYVGKITDLYPIAYNEQLIVDEGVDLVDDIFQKIAVAIFFTPEANKLEARKKLQDEILPQLLSYYDKQVLQNESGYYFDQLTIADLFLYAGIRWITCGVIEHFSYDMNKHKGLVQLVKQIEAIPEVQQWNSEHQ